MRSCAIGSAIGGLGLGVLLAIGACRTAPPADVPPVTAAPANAAVPITSDHPNDAGAADAVSTADAGGNAAVTASEGPPPTKVSIHDAAFHVDEGVCERVLVAIASGIFMVGTEFLGVGDAVVLVHPAGMDAKPTKGTGVAVEARVPIANCPIRSRPAPEKTIVRAGAAPKLEWAGGKMNAHLDIGTKLSPELYLGRIEGTAPVPEHVHAGSWEIIVSLEAAGTFLLDGKEQRLGPRQVVSVPPNTKHAWKPDPGSKLVAIQMYAPPGPEQRFLALAAAEKDAGSR
jgi:hypothetical protein